MERVDGARLSTRHHTALLFEPYVLGKIVLRRMVAFKGPDDAIAVPTLAERFLHKRKDQRPGIFCRFFPITARHRVI